MNTPNGVVHTSKPGAILPSVTDSASMKHMNDRMMFLLASLTGHVGHITLKNGEQYTGVLSGSALDPTNTKYVFKMVKRVHPTGEAQPNGTSEASGEYVGEGDSHVRAFDVADVAQYSVPQVALDKSPGKHQNGVSGFRTDTDISGNATIRERHLQRWDPTADADVDHSLEASAASTRWDQFATNEKLFGVKSNYDESFYTTTIDRSNPQYAQRAAYAERMAREIEGSQAFNDHIREERGMAPVDDKGMDEESKYSGVQREFPPLQNFAANRYTPPARRAPTGQPTVPGAPVDPAIISSQLARPETVATKSTPPPVISKEETGVPAAPKLERGNPDIIHDSKGAPKAAPEPAKDASSNVAGASAPPPTEQIQPDSSSSKPVTGEASGRKLERELAHQFKQFANTEKLRISERQRHIAKESKLVKINDLKKFALNFKLSKPLPSDLVPILAKDESKQREIVEKARRAVQEKTSSAQAAPAAADAKPTPVTNVANTASAANTSKPMPSHPTPNGPMERQQGQRPRPQQPFYGSGTARGPAALSNMGLGPRGTGMLGPRLAQNQQQYKQQGAMPYNGIPHPIPVQDKMAEFGMATPHSVPSTTSSGVQTPTSGVSALRFNVRAPDFKPNPAASTFQPVSNNMSAKSSPRPDSSPNPATPAKSEAPRAPTPLTAFPISKPSSSTELLDWDENFNPVKRLLNEKYKESEKVQIAGNGGIPNSYRTPPTWDFPTTNANKGYLAMFETVTVSAPITHPMMLAGPGPHQHQLPMHLQGPPSQIQSPHHTPRHMPVLPHPGQGGHPQFEGHAMQYSHSQSSVHPSPRPMQSYMYNAQPTVPNFPQQGQMAPYMSPVVQHGTIRHHNGQQFVGPPVPGMGGQMMTNQPSNGPYMGMAGNVQVMYPGAPVPGYSQYPGQMVPAGPNGYGSPRPTAPMMHHQGSQQGHPQQPAAFMPQGGPMYGQMPPGAMPPMRQVSYQQAHQGQHYSPQQHHGFPQQVQRGTPSSSYSQPMIQQHSMPPQGGPPTGPANHNAEVKEESK
ncbi:hypothetical protein M011DRAFT_266920 [Sporormia fimetaria CBS 119925]|uniref:LsmAD domain-containing protein n=1 Tax=Sporormia fimetaria CBS 119925 TaxID=1340428 RepID=A0A6A6UWD3_9PLEO|nr:hypothetical protein M011DRAFT_266920 [Sporormia fimetaria CBS 119925]